MKQISKSYLKLFIKSWVETLGMILFLLIFTMVIMGMLATPLQLSIRALEVRNRTNIWDKQMQSNFAISDNFANQIIFEGDEYTINYGTVVDAFEGGWFTSETREQIDRYARHLVSLVGLNEGDAAFEQSLLENRAGAIRGLLLFARNNGDDNYFQFWLNNLGENIETINIRVGDVFHPEMQALFLEENVRNNVNWFISNRILHLISENEPDFNFNIFQRFQSFIQTSTQSFNYILESADALFSSENDANLNNLIVHSGPQELNPIDLVEFSNSGIIEGYINDLFKQSHNVEVGDVIDVPLPATSQGQSINAIVRVRIVGIAEKYSTLAPLNSSIFQSMENFAQIFVHSSFFTSEILYEHLLPQNFVFSGSTVTNQQERFIANSLENINDFFIPSNLNDNFAIHNIGTLIWRGVSDHFRISTLTNLTIITWIFSIMGGILFILAFFFIIFVLKKEINSTRRQLGVFKSLGYTTKELTWIFSLKTFITMFFGIALGYLFSIPFQINAATQMYSNMVIFSFQTVYSNWVFLSILLIVIPLFLSLISYLIIFKFLNEGALTLLSSGPKEKNRKWAIIIFYVVFPFALPFVLLNSLLIKMFKRRNIGFYYRMQNSFINIGRGKYLLVMALIGFSSFLFTLQLRASPVMMGVINGAFNMFDPNLNHMYNFSSISQVTADDKLRISRTSNLPEINYIDTSAYESVEEFIQNQGHNYFLHFDEINQFMSRLIEVREELAVVLENTPNLEMLQSMAPFGLNVISLLYPLDEIDNLNVNTVIEWLFTIILFETSPTSPIILEQMQNGHNIYNLVNSNENYNSAIWLSDIGRYLCISTQPLSNSCSDLEQFQQNLIEGTENLIIPPPVEDPQENGDDISLENLIHNILSTWMLEFMIRDFTRDQFIATNSVLFNKNTDLLTHELNYFIRDNNQVDIDSSTITLFDATGAFGNPRNAYNFSTISDEQIAALQDETEELPVIISGRLARILDIDIGDTFNMMIGTQGMIEQEAIVIGINSNDNMSQTTYADYQNFMKRNAEIYLQETFHFTNLYSQDLSFEGEFDITQLQNISTMFTNHVSSTSLTTTVGESATNWLGPVLDIYMRNLSSFFPPNSPFSGFASFLEDNILRDWDTNLNYFIDANVLGGNIVVLPILRGAVNIMMDSFQNNLLMYIGINILLMVILLVVIMNIIVNDTVNVILIMRSLGYTNKKINWMVMGRYIIGSMLVFIFAYLASVLTWAIIGQIVWNQFNMLLIIPVVPWLPIVSMLAIGVILLAGWLAAMNQIKKRPLTYLVS